MNSLTKNNPAFRLSPIPAAALLCLLASPVFAQAPPQEEITVTGSRIRGIAPVGSTVVSVGRDDIESSGAVSTAQVLQQIPQVFNLGVSENSRGQSGGAGNITYGSSVNLRGIGPFATLPLVNGHRVVGQGTSSAAVDPSIIPTLAMERIEIVADGASAIYGSDAIAGVVNMILRRNENGAQGFIRFGKGGAYDERQAGALWGKRWAGGQVTLTFENDYHTALSGRDRSFFTGDLLAQGGGDFRSTQCSPGNIVIAGVSYAIPPGGVTAANANQLLPGTTNKCDNLKVQDLIPQQDRTSGAFTFNQEIGNGISLYADGFVTRRNYTFRPGALAANLTVPSTNPFYVRPPGAPAGTNETVAYSFINEVPVNRADGFSKTQEATIGADVALSAGWKAGALYTRGNNEDLSVTLGGLNNAAIAAALANPNRSLALNPFGSGANNPTTLAAIANSVAYSPGETLFHNVLLKADGPLFQLPGGTVRAAVGYEWQRYRTVGGQTTGAPTAPITGEVTLRRTVDSAYAELVVPIVGASNAVTGLQKLDITAATRTDRYSDVGSTNNPKLGINWSPVGGVTLRGSYGTSFRAPGLTQVRGFTNGGRGGLFVQNYSDPTNGGALRVGVALSAANLDLKPETAKTKSLGLDWEPKIGNKTKISINYFDIVYDNQIIGYLSDLTVLNREAAFAGTSVIQRNPSPALVAQLLATYPINGVPPATWTLYVDGRNQNLSRSVSRGFDFQASTRISTANLGSIGLGFNGTLFTKYLLAFTPASALTDQLNNIYNPLRFKSRTSASWSYGPIFANVYMNYQNGYTNNLSTPVQKVRSQTTLDARVAYALDDVGGGALKDATLALGVVNLTDRAPPFVNLAQSTNGGGGFDPTQSSPVGRVISLAFDKKF